MENKLPLINSLEPKKNDRFVVVFPEEFKIDSFTVQKINKPKFENGKWKNIGITFIDPIACSPSHGLYKIIDLKNKEENTNEKPLFEFVIKSLDPIGETVETWKILVEEVVVIDFGELDYSNSEMQTSIMIIKPKNCILES